MLFIDDDQAQIREGQEQGRARAHHHPRLAPHHRAIDAAAFLLRKIAVPFRRPHAEAGGEAFQELHRQRDLRQQDQRLLVLAQRFGHRLEIDFGLARSRHAVQQMGGKVFARRPRRAESLPPAPDRDSAPASRKPGSGARKGANSGSSVGLSAPACDQPAHHGGRDIGVFRQARHAARQSVLRHLQHALARLRQPGGTADRLSHRRCGGPPARRRRASAAPWPGSRPAD